MFDSIGTLLGLALFFVTLWEFFRGMRALGEIAKSVERIEHTLAERQPTVPSHSASHSAT